MVNSRDKTFIYSFNSQFLHNLRKKNQQQMVSLCFKYWQTGELKIPF